MKKEEEQALPNLPHIKGHNITTLASKANCDRSYVWQVLKGKRESKSALARKIILAAKEMNLSIEKAHKKADKILVEDQD